MVDNSKSLAELGVAIRRVIKKTHASTVMVLVARLEESLSRIIQGRMPNLTNNKKAELFEGYGPLSSLASKIEIAYAFGFILAEERRNLHAIKSVRNAFAHSSDFNMDFDHPSLEKPLAMLPLNQDPKTNNRKHFMDVCDLCTVALDRHLESIDLVHALKDFSNNKKTSPEK